MKRQHIEIIKNKVYRNTITPFNYSNWNDNLFFDNLLDILAVNEKLFIIGIKEDTFSLDDKTIAALKQNLPNTFMQCNGEYKIVKLGGALEYMLLGFMVSYNLRSIIDIWKLFEYVCFFRTRLDDFSSTSRLVGKYDLLSFANTTKLLVDNITDVLIIKADGELCIEYLTPTYGDLINDLVRNPS